MATRKSCKIIVCSGFRETPDHLCGRRPLISGSLTIYDGCELWRLNHGQCADVGLHSFRIRPEEDILGLRVGRQEDPLGFRVGDNGSAYVNVRSGLGVEPADYGIYGDIYPDTGLASILSSNPWLRTGQIHQSSSSQQLAAARTCREGHRACIDAGRPPVDCIRALHNCTPYGHGLPTNFAPGVWGSPK